MMNHHLTKLILHGQLKEEYGEIHYFVLHTPADLVKAMDANFPSFKKRLLQYEMEGYGYRLVSGDDIESGDSDISESELCLPLKDKSMHLIPVLQGSGSVGRILGGVVLIGAGFLLGGFGAFLGKAFIGIGASLALGGISQLLAPRPQEPSFDQTRDNTIFGAGNGQSPFSFGVGLVYGRFRIKRPAILSSGSKARAPVDSIENRSTNDFANKGYTFPSFYTDEQDPNSNAFINIPGSVEPNSFPIYRFRGNLRNRAIYSTLIAVSEGEIEGPAFDTVGHSVYIDQTPILDSDGVENFPNTRYFLTPGTPSQNIPGAFPEVTLNEVPVNVLLDYDFDSDTGTPVVRTITGGNFQTTLVKILIPQLYRVQEDGDIKTNALRLRFEVDTDGKGFVTVARANYLAKSQKPVQQTFELDLPESVSKIWNLRLTTTFINLEEEERDFGEARWSSLTEVTPNTSNYPDTSVLGLRIDAQFLGGLPDIAVEIFGIKVSVPHNYDAPTRTYSGMFNGTLAGTKVYTNNPVWILYDVLTNTRYGIGLTSDQIDVYSFYSASVYCDELVDDGNGGTEPRFTANFSLVERREGQQVVRSIASGFNAFPVWSDGKIGLVQDRPTSPIWAFTQANVAVESDNEGIESPPFEYTQTDAQSRYTAAAIAFISPDDDWETEIENVKDDDLISEFGLKTREIAAFGCTSRGQAARIGRWEIFTSNFNDEIVSFRAARDMLPLEIGNVIEIFDRDEQGIKLAGRIKEVVSSTRLILDQLVDLEDLPHTITIYYKDGTKTTRTILEPESEDEFFTTDEVDLASVLNPLPEAGDLFALRRDDISPTLWRVISIDEEDEELFNVQAAKYLDNKWAYVESGELLPEKQTSFLTAVPTPNNLTLTSVLALDDTETKLIVSGFLEWDVVEDDRVESYEVRYRRGQDSTWKEGVTDSPSFDLVLDFDEYEFQVRAVSFVGIKSSWVVLEASTVDIGKEVPSDVTGFSIDPRSSSTAILKWDPTVDADVRLLGKIRIKFSASAAGWENAQLLDEFHGNTRSGIVAALEGTYYAKWVDPFGNVSETAAELDLSNNFFFDKNIVATLTEHPAFAGVKDKCFVNTSGNLTIGGAEFFDDAAGLFDARTGNFDDTGAASIESEATYEFFNTLVLNDIQDVQLCADYKAFFTGSNAELFDDATGDFDDREGDFDGVPESNAGIDVQVRTSQDGIVFTPYESFSVATLNFLEAEFRAVLTSDGTENIEVEELSVIADVQDRREFGTVVTSAVADTTVNFSQPYVVAPAGIGHSIQSGTSGDQVEILNVTASGFDISVYQSASRIVRTVYWTTESY